jgi:hypothetical protein
MGGLGPDNNSHIDTCGEDVPGDSPDNDFILNVFDFELPEDNLGATHPQDGEQNYGEPAMDLAVTEPGTMPVAEPEPPVRVHLIFSSRTQTGLATAGELYEFLYMRFQQHVQFTLKHEDYTESHVEIICTFFGDVTDVHALRAKANNCAGWMVKMRANGFLETLGFLETHITTGRQPMLFILVIEHTLDASQIIPSHTTHAPKFSPFVRAGSLIIGGRITWEGLKRMLAERERHRNMPSSSNLGGEREVAPRSTEAEQLDGAAAFYRHLDGM